MKPVWPWWSMNDQLSDVPITRSTSPALTSVIAGDVVLGLLWTRAAFAVTVASCGSTSTYVSFFLLWSRSTLPSTVAGGGAPVGGAAAGARPMSRRIWLKKNGI